MVDIAVQHQPEITVLSGLGHGPSLRSVKRPTMCHFRKSYSGVGTYILDKLHIERGVPVSQLGTQPARSNPAKNTTHTTQTRKTPNPTTHQSTEQTSPL